MILCSELFLVGSGMVIKQLGTGLPVAQVVFFRNLFGLGVLLPWLLRCGLVGVHTRLLRFHMLRAAVGVCAMSCLFYSWGHLPLAQAALLKQTAPFFIPLIGWLWLKERIGLASKLAVLIGFAGVYAVLSPQSGVINGAVLVAVGGAMLGALAKVTIRRMSVSEGPQRIVFYFALFSTLLSAPVALWGWVTPSVFQWGWLLILALTSTLAQLLLSKGYSYAEAGKLGPFTYGSVVFAALFGGWLWDEQIALHTGLGIGLITLAGGLAFLPRRAGQKQKPAEPAKVEP